MEPNNWILKKHIDNIVILSEEYLPFYKKLLISKGIIVNEDLDKSESFINWNMYPKNYDFFYDYEGCENDIMIFFHKSDLSKSEYVIMDFGYRNPIVQIKTEYFIDNWYEFINGAHFESTVISDDGNYILEFNRGGILRSSFRVKG